MANYSIKYTDYLKSAQWRQRRLDKLLSVGYQCEICHDKNVPLQVHHLTYEHLGDEDNSELLVVCIGHHWVVDQIRKRGENYLSHDFLKSIKKTEKQRKHEIGIRVMEPKKRKNTTNKHKKRRGKNGRKNSFDFDK